MVVAIIGSSGAGKSTLIRCVNRLVEPTSGSVVLNGTEITGLGRHGLRQARRRVGMIFQEYNLVERLTVMENVLSGRLGYVSFWRAYLRQYPRAPMRSPAASASASASPARSCSGPSFCWSTSRPPASIPRLRARSCA
jgi:ABC-type phosphate/phosphonate transport system ATPase subunit